MHEFGKVSGELKLLAKLTFRGQDMRLIFSKFREKNFISINNVSVIFLQQHLLLCMLELANSKIGHFSIY